MEQTLKNLPIGIQDFESLINDGYLYVDKTALMHRTLQGALGYTALSKTKKFYPSNATPVVWRNKGDYK